MYKKTDEKCAESAISYGVAAYWNLLSSGPLICHWLHWAYFQGIVLDEKVGHLSGLFVWSCVFEN